MFRVGTIGLAIALALPGCGDNEGTAQVLISGEHAVSMGQRIWLSASTSGSADTAYTWSVDDESVATVDAQGVVRGVGPGEAMVSATGMRSGATGTHVVVVSQAVITLSGTTVVLTGDTVTLTAATVSGNDSGYVWTSSDERVATVSAQGVIKGESAGQATISARGNDTGVSASVLMIVSARIPNYEGWLESAHADATAPAFRNWDDEDPREIPTTCARCHSSPGFLDYIGEDGSRAGVVDQPAAVGTVISCQTCHNAAADALATVTFPSGVELTDLGAEARCMTCHQGRSSRDTVAEAVQAAGGDEDTTSPELHFINIHYYAAGATLNAGRVRGGYQYEAELGQAYDWRFRHVPGRETCMGCHDPHSLAVRVDECKTCHTGVTTVDDLRNVRMIASRASDYDGDGDLGEGMYFEIQGLGELLFTGIRTYATEHDLGAICYAAATYPYWFIDTNGDGTCSATEATYANRFDAWTPRLLKAAYNYQVAAKDPGGFAHNAKYIIQLLHDSTRHLNEALAAPVDLASADRNDPGHFNGASEAARNWDGDEAVAATCSKCHSGSQGFRFFLEYGVGTAVPEQDNGLDCATCHDDLQSTFTTIPVDAVLFPSGIEIKAPGSVSNLCMSCHSGREAKATVDATIAANKLRFINIHYLPAGAIKKGGQARVGYEYSGKTYASDWVHAPGNECTFCHDPLRSQHSFRVEDVFERCTELCHTTASDPTRIRGNPFFAGALHAQDYDGDGSSTERLTDEIADLAAALLARIQATATTGPICYAGDVYPYFFKDTNGNNVCDASETVNANRFAAWTPALMKATYNYQISRKEHGAWVHNFDYMAQLLIDSIEDLGGSGAVADYIRP